MNLIFFCFFFFSNFLLIKTCDETKCSSKITKCLSNNSCNCENNDFDCISKCYSCLGYSFSNCCSCLNFCPKIKQNINKDNSFSTIEKLEKPFPKLFELLTKENDKSSKWTSYNLTQYFENEVLKTEIVYDPDLKNTCKIVFFSKCISWAECKSKCTALRSNFYRWFKNGCCECGGENCLNYGLDKGKCSDCFI